MRQQLISDLIDVANLPDSSTLARGRERGTLESLARYMANVADVVGEAMLKFKADFMLAVQAASVVERTNNLRTFLVLIGGEQAFGATPPERVLRVVRWCRTFGPGALLDNSQNRVIRNMNLVAEMIDEVHDSGQAVSKGFRDYCAKVADAAANVYLMREALGNAGKGKTTVYNVIHFLHQNGLQYDNMTAANIANVFDMAFKAPPYTKFTGVDRWGSGNHSSPEENMRMHFFKHCLDAHPNESEKLTWHEECPLWWTALGIELKRDLAEAKAPPILFARLKPMFGSEDALPAAQAGNAAKAARETVGWGDALLDHLHGAYGKAYADRAIAMNRNMSHVMVHGDIKKNYAVMLKGINGRFFIGSRIEGGELTISTCFAPRPDVDLATVNADLKLWDIL